MPTSKRKKGPGETRVNVITQSKTDDRLVMGEGVELTHNFVHSSVRTFRPLNIADTRKEVLISDPMRFLDTRSMFLVVEGRIMNKKADGTLEELPTTQLSSKVRDTRQWYQSGNVTRDDKPVPIFKVDNVVKDINIATENDVAPMNLFAYGLWKGESK